MQEEVRNRFAELRSLCQKPPSADVWRAILGELASWPDQETKMALAVPYVSDHLAHWPDEFRVCDEHGVTLLLNGEVPDYFQAVRHIGEVTVFAGTRPGLAMFEYTSPEDLDWLVDNPMMQHIHSLNLRNHQLDDAALMRIVSSPYLKQLKHLDLGGNDFSSEGFANFAQSLEMPDLDHLALWRTDVDDDGVAQLCRNPSMAKLGFLELGRTSITPQSIEWIAQSPYINNLYNLCVWQNSLDPRIVRALSDPKFASIRTLEIQEAQLDADSIRALCASAVFEDIEELSLRANPIGEEGAYALIEHPGMSKLHRLGLNEIELSDEVVEALFESPHMGSLRHVNLWDTQSSNGLECLAKSTVVNQLRGMRVSHNSSEHLKAAFTSENTKHLETFSMYRCSVRYYDFRAALKCEHFRQLKSLDLSSSTGVGPACARYLAETPMPNLEALYLSNTNIGSEGLEHLFNTTLMPNLKTLYLGQTGVDDDLLAQLADSGLLLQLESLGLWRNDLTVRSIDLVMTHPAFQGLDYLGMHNNSRIFYHMYARLTQAENLKPGVRQFYSYAL